MNRFFTLLFAASCLTAVGQVPDCTNESACNYGEEGECEFPSCGCDCESDCLSGEATILFYPFGGCDLENPPTEFYLPNAELSCLFSNGYADGDFAEGDSCQLYLNGNLVFEGIPGSYYGPQIGYGTLEQPYLTPENFPCGIDTLVFKFPRPNNDTLTLTGFWSPEHPFCGDLSYLSGCTDIEAINFSSDFLCDDGSCIYLGCTDPLSCNFDVTANSDDGSCDYSCCPGPGCCGEGMFWDWNLGKCAITNPADINLDGCVQLNDLLDLLSAYGDCGAEESAWQCGDPLEHQGYDYETVQIGEQCWFAENLRSENYENGDAIPSNLSDSEWSSTSSGATTVYEEESANLEVYGRLYNWYVVNDFREICPSGWYVPSDGDWLTLEQFMGMPQEELILLGYRGGDVADELKSEFYWMYNGEDAGGDNSTGFTALPSGSRGPNDGAFTDISTVGNFWTSSINENTDSDENAFFRRLSSLNNGIYREYTAPRMGYSIRCIKD